MNILDNLITPYIGIEEIKLLQDITDVTNYLSSNGIKFTIEERGNKGCDPEVPWSIIRTNSGVSLAFAKNKLWQITVSGEYKGKLSNGICIGMDLEEAEKIDDTLKYDDSYELFISDNGYWLEDDLDSKKIRKIIIFIKEVLSEEFWSYKWAE